MPVGGTVHRPVRAAGSVHNAGEDMRTGAVGCHGPRVDHALAQLADAQGGVFTTIQAYALGHTRRTLATLRARGSVVSLGRSAYAATSALPADAVARHALTVEAALLVYPDAVPCGASLLAMAGVDLWRVPLDRVDLVRPVSKEVLTQMCRVRPESPLMRTRDQGGAEAIARAVALTAVDHGAVQGVVAADCALRRGMTTVEAVTSTVAALGRWPHAGRGQTMVAFMDGRSESVGESRLRVLLRAAGFDVVPQVAIEDPPGSGHLVARVDFLVAGTNVVIEFDGRVKYADGDPHVLWREKKREDRLRRLGYIVVRVTWADLEHPRALVATLRSEISRTSPRK